MRLSAITPSPTQSFIPFVASISAAVESVSSLEYADATFASRSPFLTITEPSFLLLRCWSALLVEPIRTTNSFHDLFYCFLFILGPSRTHCRPPPSPAYIPTSLGAFGGKESTGPNRWTALGIPHSRSRSISASWHLHHLAELVGLARFAFADYFRGRLERAEDFTPGASIAAKDPGFGLLDYLSYPVAAWYRSPSAEPPALPVAGMSHHFCFTLKKPTSRPLYAFEQSLWRSVSLVPSPMISSVGQAAWGDRRERTA